MRGSLTHSLSMCVCVPVYVGVRVYVYACVLGVVQTDVHSSSILSCIIYRLNNPTARLEDVRLPKVPRFYVTLLRSSIIFYVLTLCCCADW